MGVGRFGLGRLGATIGGFTGGTKSTQSRPVFPWTLKTRMLEGTAWTSKAAMKLEAKTLGNSWQICPCPRLHDIGRLWFFGKRRLSPKPQFPMQNAPGECGGLLLTQKTEVLIIIPPIMAPCCQVLNYFPIFHEGRGLSWILKRCKCLQKSKSS